MKKKYFLVVDTETIVKSQKVFDVGYRIIDLQGNIHFQRQILIVENFKETLFFENKRGLYIDYIAAGIAELKEGINALEIIIEDLRVFVEDFGIKKAYAYNAVFDERVLGNLSKQFMGFNVFEDLKFVDLWEQFVFLVGTTEKFRKWAELNDHLSDKGNIKTSAETAFAYITKSPNFTEEHTALEDTDIEAKILLYLRKVWQRKGKPNFSLKSFQWIVAQRREQIGKYGNKKWIEIWEEGNRCKN